MVNFSDLQLHDMEPVYVQIVRHLKRAIFLGEAAVGESLPSRRELAAQLCINPNTAQKAFRLMEKGSYRHRKTQPARFFMTKKHWAESGRR